MLKSTITDIFFDLDHTLWDFQINSDIAFGQLLQKHQLPFDLQEFLNVYEPINQQYWIEYAQQKRTKEEVKYGRLTDTFKQLNYSLPKEKIKLLAQDYLDLLKQGTALIPGTIVLLDYLKPKYHLHILTNGFAEVQADKLKNAGIDHYFDHLITSEETGKLKPHPIVFKQALKKAGSLAHKSFMIGDNLKTDVLGARNAGMHAIHFDPADQSDIDFKIIPKVRRLIEIKEIL